MEATPQFEKGERWYCVRSKPKKERMAAGSLASLHGLEVFCPQIRFQRKTVRGPCWFQEAMFPGYLFARFDLFEMKNAVAYAPGVLNIPSFDNRIVSIPDAVIESLQKDLDEESVVEAVAPLEVGEETMILEGSMRGLKVKVIKLMPAQERVAVLMKMMGTLVEAVFPVDALEHRIKHPMAVGE
jgi:transcriptional antiterminator RfaH